MLQNNLIFTTWNKAGFPRARAEDDIENYPKSRHRLILGGCTQCDDIAEIYVDNISNICRGNLNCICMLLEYVAIHELIHLYSGDRTTRTHLMTEEALDASRD